MDPTLWMKRFPCPPYRRGRRCNALSIDFELSSIPFIMRYSGGGKHNISSGFRQEFGTDRSQKVFADIVVVSANFWDLGRWVRELPEALEVTSAGRDLFQDELKLWQQHFVRLLEYVQVNKVAKSCHLF